LILIALFRFPFANHQACIARHAKNIITTPKIVVTSENLAEADVKNLGMALASVGKSDDEVDKKQQASNEKWLAGATNPKGLLLVSSEPIYRSTEKYDSPFTLNPITRALSTFITDI
jgi:hypothetical protein